MEECRETFKAMWSPKETMLLLRHGAFEQPALEAPAAAALPRPED